jgi:branched-chain amino acid transport system substrate-binding protein
LVILRQRAALTAVLAALALVGAGPSGEPFKIDVILPLTGNSAFSGRIHADAIHVYEQQANATGGIHGRPVHFEIHDDQSNPVISVQLANQIVASNPPVLLGSATVAACSAEAPLLKNGTVEYCLSPGLTTKQANVFASSVPITYIIPTTIKFFRERGYTRIAAITTTDASGQAADIIAQAALARPENKSIRMVAYEHFNPTDISVSAQIARIKAGDPQGLIVYATGSGFGNIIRALHDTGLDVPVVTTASNMNENQLEQYNSAMPRELIFNTALYVAPELVSDRRLKAAIAEFYAAYKRAGIEPSPESSLSWDPAKIVVGALRALPAGATGEQLMGYISNLHDFPGASGTYDFRSGDHHGLTDAALLFVKWVPATKKFVAVTHPGGSPLPF